MQKQITIFYSWQSDLPNNNNRNLIQSSIDMAVKNLNRNAIAICADRDTAGKPGTPDIVETIFRKIDEADMFIADISIINPGAKTRKTPNPNVLLELGYAARSLGWNRIICFINSEYGAHEDLPFDLRTRRIMPYSVVGIEKSKAKKTMSGIIESTVRKLLEDDMLPAQNDEIRSNKKLLSSLLQQGLERAWEFYYQKEMDLPDDYTETNFVVVTDIHFEMIETVRHYINLEQYFLLHEMFDLLRKMRNGTEDMAGWEYAPVFIEKHLEPLYLEYFLEMEKVNLVNALTEKALDSYNALLDKSERTPFTTHRYSNEGKLIFYSDPNNQVAYDKEGNLLCKLEVDDVGLITGWKKTDEYIGEYKDGCRHGNGIEYDYDINIDYGKFKKREGRWHYDRFIEGKVNGTIIYKNEGAGYSWEPDDQGLPLTKAYPYLKDHLQSKSPINCKNYYFAYLVGWLITISQRREPHSSTISTISEISQSRALHILTSTSVVTFSPLPNLAMDAVLIPAAILKSFFNISLSIKIFHNFL